MKGISTAGLGNCRALHPPPITAASAAERESAIRRGIEPCFDLFFQSGYYRRMNKYKLLLKCLFLFSFVILTGCTLINFDDEPGENNEKSRIFSTWWWWVEPKNHTTYLDFAAKNGINEIYYYTESFSNVDATLIENAGKLGIKVFLLLDDYNYIWDYAPFERAMNKFIDFQHKQPANRRFAGLHLDIEPQEHPEYSKNLSLFHQNYLDFVVWVCSNYRSQARVIDFDIGWWFDDYVIYRGNRERLYKALILEADRVCIMAYKDKAETIYNISKEEIEFAKSLNKEIILGVETDNLGENSDYTFYGKGLAYLNEQLSKLRTLIDYENSGIAIHYISTWYPMTR